MVPELKAIISAWFVTFSTELTREQVIEISQQGFQVEPLTAEQAQEIPETVRAMTKENCVDFAEAITTLKDLKIDDYRVTSLFEKYSRMLGNGNLIIEEEFLNFYGDQAKGNKDEVVR